MERLLLITGRLAENEVRKAAKKLGADVLVLPVDIALFIGPKMAASAIRKTKRGYSKIIFPGLTRFDVSVVEKEVGMPCFKGPGHASDIVRVLNSHVALSKSEPADFVVEKRGLDEYALLVRQAETKKPELVIGGLKISKRLPPRIIAEIVDAPNLTDKRVLERAEYYLKSGADIIDVGAIASEENSKRLGKIVKLLKRKIKAPVSIDSLNPKEINAAITAGADLVLSLDSDNMKSVKKSDKVAYVVIPDKKLLKENLVSAKRLGFRNLVADPILHPPFRVAESLLRYKSFKGAPLLMGASNVVELMDVDSIGVNGLLAELAIELGISLILVTENSYKTRNSIREMKRAIEMCYLAKLKGTSPKDLGFNLLLAKSKTGGDILDISGAHMVMVGADKAFASDPKGHFKIHVDFGKGRILAAHYKDVCDFVFEGKRAEDVSKKIIKSGLVSNLEHAAYLGRELQKAEIYLRLKKTYVQDEDFAGL